MKPAEMKKAREPTCVERPVYTVEDHELGAIQELIRDGCYDEAIGRIDGIRQRRRIKLH